MTVKQLPAEIENSIPVESQSFISLISPLAFYNTWTGGKIPPDFKSFLKNAGVDKPVAVSAVVATIGPGPEDVLSRLLMSGDTLKAHIWTALCEDAADIALNFIFKLLVEDAEKDDCEVPEVVAVADETALSLTLELLEAGSEKVRLENGHLSPRFTRVGLAAWVPVSKKKNAFILAKKAG